MMPVHISYLSISTCIGLETLSLFYLSSWYMLLSPYTIGFGVVILGGSKQEQDFFVLGVVLSHRLFLSKYHLSSQD